jgi:micrococcal nuclease
MLLSRRRLIGLMILMVATLLIAACEDVNEDNDNTSDTIEVAMPSRPANLDSVRVQRIIDGDTLDLSDGRRVRLLGINTPEREEALYAEASSYLGQLVESKIVGLEYDQERFDQFDRTLAYIWLEDRLVNIDIVLQGYASAYIIPPNERYARLLRQAEAQAQTAGIGLWQRGMAGLEIRTINYDAPGPDNENPNGEWIEIRNISGNTINLDGYTIEDSSSSNLYRFRSISLAARQEIRLYSGCGSNTNRELYWCDDSSVWNNDGDTATLRDANGGLVDTYRYSD